MPFSVDCDLSNGRIAAGDNNATFLAFAYTNTPQLKAELQFLRALAAPPKDGYRFRSAQDDTDVVVMQVPSIDQVHEHTVELPLLEEVLASVNAVHAYDRKRRHRRRKRFLFYGRIPTTGYERGLPRGSTTGSAKLSIESSGVGTTTCRSFESLRTLSRTGECGEKQRGISTTQGSTS